MHQYLKDLVEGKFVYEVPEICFSVTKIVLEVPEHETIQGSFFIYSENEISLKGTVYSSDYRFLVKTNSFEGEKIQIFYEFQSDGLIEGDVYEGELCFICNQREQFLSFHAQITQKYGVINGEKICSLDTFAMVAESNWEEAYHLFRKPFFVNILKDSNSDIQMVYEAICRKTVGYQCLEEFLIYIQKKNVVLLTLEQYDVEVVIYSESIKKEVVLQRDSWGYVGIDLIKEGDFFSIDKEHLNQDEFVGSVCRLAYIIHQDKLHGGKNYGTITIKTMTQTLIYSICATKEKQEIVGKKPLLMEQKYLLRVCELYLKFRLNQLRMGIWAQESGGYLDQLMGLDKNNDWYNLMKAQVLLINSQKQEAQWILDQFKNKKIDKNKNYNLWGYYLYLCTLDEKDPSFVNKKQIEIQKLFKKNGESVVLTWILLFLDEGLNRAKEEKWHFLESYIQNGCHSSFIYLEAYYLLDKFPYLLTKLSFFEIQILNWAKKHQCITKEIAMQFFQLLKGEKKFNTMIYGLCEGCFEQYQERDAVAAICSYLIKCNRSQTKYFRWFEKGIYFDLRITRLYEYYMMSIEVEKLKQLPQKVSMYFRMNSGLNERYKTLLYAAVIENKEAVKDLFIDYRQAMELFAIAQISKGAINEELAVIYKTVIGITQITENIGRAYVKICFTNRLVCNNGNMNGVIVIHKQLKLEKKYPIHDQVAYVQIYTNDFLILFEDVNGHRYGSTVAYTRKPLFDTACIEDICNTFASKHLPFVVYQISNKRNFSEFSKMDWFLVFYLIEQEEISDSFKKELCGQIISHNQELLSKQFWEWIPRNKASKLIGRLVELKNYEDAYALVGLYGMNGLTQEQEGRLVSYLIEQKKEERWMLASARKLFLVGVFDVIKLEYLVANLKGSLKELIAVYMAAQKKSIHLPLLEERILMQALYTAKEEKGLDDVFMSYKRLPESQLLEHGYIAYTAYRFLKQEKEMAPNLCSCIYHKLVEKQEIPFICKIAYLKYLSQKNTILPDENDLLFYLLEELLKEGLYFSFYKNFAKDIALRYQLYDQYILEYHTNPENKVIVHYRIQCENGEQYEYKQVEMKHMYAGIFVKRFLLFVGETKEYFIEDVHQAEKKTMAIKLFPMCPISDEEPCNRYELLNEMLLTHQLKEYDALAQQMGRYEAELVLTEKNFTIL